jgi:hypothetical protein
MNHTVGRTSQEFNWSLLRLSSIEQLLFLIRHSRAIRHTIGTIQ